MLVVVKGTHARPEDGIQANVAYQAAQRYP
jgi:hypothetical protein